MSAFIVRNELINRIVTEFMTGGYSSFTVKLREILPDIEPETLGNALYKMNCEAVRQRYGEYKDMVGEKYRYKKENYRLVQVYKDIGCLRYQCSEGNVPNTPLYKWLDGFQQEVADVIISKMDTYKLTTWG